MKLLVYLPALNEARTIGGVLDAIPTSIPGISEIQRVVIDDGSTDGTEAIAREHGASVIRHRRNLGTGRAFVTGVQAGIRNGADIVLGMDADGQFRPEDIKKLVEPIVSGQADVVLCTRFGPKSELIGSMPFMKRLGNQALCRLISFVVGQRFTDVSCGFRAFTREAALRVDIHSDFEYIHESLLTWHRFGLQLIEVELPVLAERPVGKSRILASVRKYAVRSAPVFIRAVRDYSPFKFFGALSLLSLVVSIALGLGVFIHWLRTSETAPYTSFITVAVGGVLLAVLLGAVALLADLVARLKFQVEELLHDSRRIRESGRFPE